MSDVSTALCVSASGLRMDSRGKPIRILTGDGDDITQHREVPSDPRSSVVLYHNSERYSLSASGRPQDAERDHITVQQTHLIADSVDLDLFDKLV